MEARSSALREPLTRSGGITSRNGLPRRATTCESRRWSWVPRWIRTGRFHAQQASEKTLKGLLTRHQIEFEKTHNIGELLWLAGAVIPDLLRMGEAAQLTRYAVADRYPLSGSAIDRDTAAQHVTLGRQVVTAVETALRDYLGAGRPSS